MLNRVTWLLAVLFVSCRPGPLVVAIADGGDSIVEPIDGGTTALSFPTTMGEPFTVSTPRTMPDNSVGQAASAVSGDVVLVAWAGLRGVRAVRTTFEGVVLDAWPLELAGPALVDMTYTTVDVITSGGGFTVRWSGPRYAEDTTLSLGPTMYSAQVTTAGVASEPALNPSGPYFGTMAKSPCLGSTCFVGINSSGARAAFTSTSDFNRQTTFSGPIWSRPALASTFDHRWFAALVGSPGQAWLEVRLENRSGQTEVFRSAIHLERDERAEQSTRVVFAMLGEHLALFWRDSNTVWARTLELDEHEALIDSAPVALYRVQAAFGPVAAPLEALATRDALLVPIRNGLDWQASAPIAVRFDPVLGVVGAPLEGTLPDRMGALRALHFDGARLGAVITYRGTGSGHTAVVRAVGTNGRLEVGDTSHALPGQTSFETAPMAKCGRRSCGLSWREFHEDRGVWLERFSLLALDAVGQASPIYPGPTGFGDEPGFEAPSLTAQPDSFIAAQTRCRYESDGGVFDELRVTTVPGIGVPGTPVTVGDGESSHCNWRESYVVPESDGEGAVILVRDARVIFDVAADGAVSPRTNPIVNRLVGTSKITALISDGWLIVALSDSGSSQLWFARGAEVFEGPMISSPSVRLLELPGAAGVAVVSTTSGSQATISLQRLDLSTRTLGAPEIVAKSERSIRSFEVASSPTRWALLSFESALGEPGSLMFRSSDGKLRLGGARLVSDDVAPNERFSVASARAGGAWVTTYETFGGTTDNLTKIGATRSRVTVRMVFAHEAKYRVE